MASFKGPVEEPVKSFVLRPTPKQEALFARRMGGFRWLFNKSLERWFSLPDRTKGALNRFRSDLSVHLFNLRREFRWLRDLHNRTLEDVVGHVVLAIETSMERSSSPGRMFRTKKIHRRLPIRSRDAKLRENAIKIAGVGTVLFDGAATMHCRDVFAYTIVRERGGGGWRLDVRMRIPPAQTRGNTRNELYMDAGQKSQRPARRADKPRRDGGRLYDAGAAPRRRRR